MVPILAAITAAGTAERLVSGALSAWKALSSSERTDDAKSADVPESFGALMRAQGIDAGSPLAGVGSVLAAITPGQASAETARFVDATAQRLVNRLA